MSIEPTFGKGVGPRFDEIISSTASPGFPPVSWIANWSPEPTVDWVTVSVSCADAVAAVSSTAQADNVRRFISTPNE